MNTCPVLVAILIFSMAVFYFWRWKALKANIAELRRIENELKESEERYRKLIEFAGDAIFVADAKTGILLDANKKAEQLIGLSRKRIIGMHQTQLHPKDETERYNRIFNDHVRNGAGLITNVFVSHASGRNIPVEINATTLKIKGKERVVGIFRDISEHKEADDKLKHDYDVRRTENLLMAVSQEHIALGEFLERALDLIFSIPWFFVEPKGAIFLVEDKPGVLVMKCEKGLPEAVRKSCAELPFGKCLCGRAAATKEIQFAAGIDERHEIRYEGMEPHGHYCVPVLSAGKVIGVLSLYLKEGYKYNKGDEDFLNTIANILTLGIVRKKLEKQAEESLKVKLHFTQTVSHELRSPLTAIKEGIDVILDGTTGAINENQKKIMDIAKRNVDRLRRLIDDVLDFQKLEAGKMALRIEENDINDVAREAQRAMASLVGRKGLDFILNLDAGLPKARFDRDRIIQVMTNLITNSVKFTDKGAIIVSTAQDGDFIKVSVKDTGLGIKKEFLPKLFQEFMQLDMGISRTHGGTGLGLAISKDIIETHKGKIWAESEFGRGATFHFTLPLFS